MNIPRHEQNNPQKLLKVGLLGLASTPLGIIIFFVSAFVVGEIIAWVDMFDGWFVYTVSFLLSFFVIMTYLFILFSTIGFVILLTLTIVNLIRVIVQKAADVKSSENA